MITENFSQIMKCKLFYNDSFYEKKLKSWTGSVNEQNSVGNMIGNFNFTNCKAVDYEIGKPMYEIMGGLAFTIFPVFGSGNSAEHITDYKLENPVSDIHVLSMAITPNRNYGNGSAIAFYTISVVNNNNYPVDLSEIALCVYNDSNNFEEEQIYILSRDVFPTVSVQPGEYYTFTIAIA